MKCTIGWIIPTLLATAAMQVQADEREGGGLNVAFTDCTEFVGVASVPESKARVLVPSQYQLVVDDGGAKLVVRIAHCQGVAVNNRPAQAGTVAHLGIMLYSPDGTGTDPNTAINNYTVTYASNVPALVNGLRKQGVPAQWDGNLTYEVTPTSATNEFYAAVSPDGPGTITWFLHGAVTEPAIASEFLANWWFYSKKGEVKMATSIGQIYFDFGSTVSFFTARDGVIGDLLGGNSVANFALSFRGKFSNGQMAVTRAR
ncbi:hypothetical protein [Methylomonas rosea]|uniref:Uncharacterized protein n=1 Tax=Methylomonas rosea TaxID=2952227 RepID=A0ABT1TV66_9GAMM|nr:hypothetical protein [Methylomonas sp. WSC-7]MCQ8118663.1 hypothetical protein [Methylomonas sp. WSC-7]